jgi:hypothetical protein
MAKKSKKTEVIIPKAMHRADECALAGEFIMQGIYYCALRGRGCHIEPDCVYYIKKPATK